MRASRFIYILIAALLVSCNSGNKVVSSFGKRKYAKGYYVNSSGEKNAVRHVAGNYVKETKEKPLYNNPAATAIEKKKVVDYSVRISSSSITPIVLATNSKPKITESEDRNDQVNIAAYGDHPNTELSKYDKSAKAGNIIGIVSIVLALVFFPLGFFSGIIGFVVSIDGLKSEKYHKKAAWGVELNLAAILLAIVFYLLLAPIIEFFAAIGTI